MSGFLVILTYYLKAVMLIINFLQKLFTINEDWKLYRTFCSDRAV